MAHKQDSFWEDHEPVYSNDPTEPEELGMVAEEVRDWKIWGSQLVLWIPIFVLVLYTFFDSGIESVGISFDLIFLIPIVCVLEILIHSALRRYRLVEDDAWAEGETPAPRRPHALLRHIFETPELFVRLGLPQDGDSPGYFHPYTFGPTIWVLFIGYGIAMFYASLGLILFLNWLPGVYLALILVPHYRPLRLWLRVRKGVRALGTGQEVEVAKAYPRRFEDVQRAELRWDTFLGQSYLLLGFKDKQLRYYAPTDDPLYVLRIAKHRMPQVKLSVQPI
jgi:hypothetical protein